MWWGVGTPRSARYRRRMDTIEIETARLRARPWEPGDEAWFVTAIDADVRRYTRMPTDADLHDWFEEDALDPPSGSTAAALTLADGTVIGNLATRSEGDRIELSYWVDAHHRGQGYASEALGALTSWAARQDGVVTLELEITPDNVASIAVAERNGFSSIGLRSSCGSCADAEGNVAVYRLAAASIPSGSRT